MNLFNGEVLFNWSLAGTILGGINLIFITLITGRHFDKVLKQHNLPLPPPIASLIPFSITNRSAAYIAFIIFNGPRKPRIGKNWSQYRNQIGDFNFRQHARFIDYVLAAIMMVGVICMVLLILCKVPNN
jgi:hypothetical protein